MSRANYTFVKDHPRNEPLIIRDVGPWDEHPTVTNDAEAVVSELLAKGMLPRGRQLLYYDSEGELTEIVVRNGRFGGFRAPMDLPKMRRLKKK